MSWPELHHTLAELVDAFGVPFDAATSSGHRVDYAEIDVPLEVTTARGPNGPIVFARAPHTRWISGVLPVAQAGHLVIETWSDPVRLDGGLP